MNSISKNSSIGYILEVDLEYPSELHDLHNDYPSAPERLEISQNMLSKYCLSIANKYGIKIDGVNKLIMVNNGKDYVKCICKPSFISQSIFSKNFVAIHEIKPVLVLNKPICVEFSILDFSKLLMYESHYKCIKSKFDAKLLFTNTDSLFYEIKTEDVYEDFYQDKNLFDFSDY